MTDKETLDKIIANCFDVEEYPLNDKGMYEGYEIPCGRNFRPQWISSEESWWWSEDLVSDHLKKEKVFGDRPILLTRNLKGKRKDSPLNYVFKGPLSKVDLWIPNYGFGEIKTTLKSDQDLWAFDLDHRSINNIYTILSLEEMMTAELWKNNKIFLIVVHKPSPGDKMSISVIDLREKFEFEPPRPEKKTNKPWFSPNQNHIKINVSAPDCLKRFDDIPYRKYRARCHGE
jgi:hypothetical protein